MRSVLNHLVQLQELTLIRDEQRSLPGGMAKLGRLNEDIDSMTDALVPDVKALYMRLYKRDHIVVAPLNDGSCSMCGMRLAISTIQAVRLCRELQMCPSCTRILHDTTGPKWVGERPKRTVSERKAGIARFSAPDLMVPDLKAKTREEAIAALAKVMESERFVDNAAKLVDAALGRESVVSTAVGHGIAFPHVRGVEGGGLAMALGVSREGIAFDGPDAAPTHFVFFSTIPTAVSAFYLKLMAGISEAFRKESNRTAALEADTPEALWRVLAKATRYTVK